MLYDGDCGFCAAAADWIVGRSAVTIDAVPYQSADTGLLARSGLTHADLAAAVHVVDDGAVFRGAAAVNHLLRGRQPYATLVRVAEGIPGLLPCEERIYAFVARHRAAISRLLRRSACRRT